jgi:carbon-monoxide dehydrogenase medium subunit
MALEIACGRVRNRGTVGGNLCLADPQGDPPAALLALEAELELHGPGGRRRLPIADFFRHVYTTALEDDEVLERIYVPGLSSAAGTAYLKFGARAAMDYAATISAAVKLVRDGADGAVSEVAFGIGGVGITPVRPRGAEAALRGQPPVPEVLEAMTEALHSELEPVADILHSADYKRHIAGVLLRRAVARACGVGVPESTP